MTYSTKTVVITGTSSGFGEGAAHAFADRGFRAWDTMRDAAGRNACKKAALQAHSPKVPFLEMDVTDDASVAPTADRVCSNPVQSQCHPYPGKDPRP